MTIADRLPSTANDDLDRNDAKEVEKVIDVADGMVGEHQKYGTVHRGKFIQRPSHPVEGFSRAMGCVNMV